MLNKYYTCNLKTVSFKCCLGIKLIQFIPSGPYSPTDHIPPDSPISDHCTTFHRYPIFSKRFSVLCKVYTGYCGTSEIEHGLCACTVDNPLAKARGLSLRTGVQPMLYLPLVIICLTFSTPSSVVLLFTIDRQRLLGNVS